MIFLTVGSMFPFDRLIRSVDELVAQGVIAEPVHAQIGDGTYEPRHMPFERFLSKPQYEQLFRSADSVIAHAGAGTIALALQYSKPLLVLPRLGRHAEHVNDHQVETARKFAQLQHVLLAEDVGELREQVPRLKTFVPQPRVLHAQQLAARIGRFLRECS